MEGEGDAFARRSGEETGGGRRARGSSTSVRSRRRRTLADRRRVDVVTARSERYERPGALPHVSPATDRQDLKRRDFTVNAMAVELGSGAFGRAVDPCGGGADWRRRRLRILHPLSFVEDPTRIFRAARYAARLGFRSDAVAGARSALALRHGAVSRAVRPAARAPSWSGSWPSAGERPRFDRCSVARLRLV